MVEEQKKFMDLEDLDMSLIDDIPWAQDAWQIISSGVQKSYLNWVKIVVKMGHNSEVINKWVKVFIEQIESTCCELVSDVEHLQAQVIYNIEQLLTKTQQLCRDLHLPMPVIGKQELSLYEERDQLKKRVDELQATIETKRAEINKLRDRQLSVCKCLGQSPKMISDSPLPSPDEIEEFQRHIDALEAEKFNREERFLALKQEILDIMEELQMQPDSDFERDVCSHDDSKFIVTKDNMKQLDLFYNSLKRQKQRIRDDIDHLWEEIDKLWKMLEEDIIETEAFRKKYTSYTLATLEALEVEVKRCEDLKKANIKRFVDKLRDELEALWERCHCSGAQKESFPYLYSNCYTEDLLELYESEIAKWKRYYEKTKEVISLLEKHDRLWQKMLVLEENATGPNRYKNRGGQLLKEEKERNKLAKCIPQIEEEMLAFAKRFEEKNNVPFLTFGSTVEEYISRKHEGRENERKNKLSARKQLREQTLTTPAKSCTTLFPSTSTHNVRATPTSAPKRKIPGTPRSVDISKKPKIITPRNVLTEGKNRMAVKSPKTHNIPTIRVTTSRSKRLSYERKKRIEKCRRISGHKSQHSLKENDHSVTEYDKFQMEVSNREKCRSTLLPTFAEELAMPLSKTPIHRTPKIIRKVATPKSLKLGVSPKNPRSPGSTSPRGGSKLTLSNLKLIF